MNIMIADGTHTFVIDGIVIKVAVLKNVIQNIGLTMMGMGYDENTVIEDSWLSGYFRDFLYGNITFFELELNKTGLTDFQKAVFDAALLIPYGRTVSYQELAEKIGGKKYARAVGMALSKNPFPLAVPCHRVLPKNSDIEHPGRFGGGTSLKKKLLKIENENKKDPMILF